MTIFNTLARARVILGQGEWEALFRRSEEVLHEREPTHLARTWNYLAHGLLRHGRLDEADSVLTQVENWPGVDVDDMSRLFCHFHRAELYRLRGRCWVSEEFERPRTESKVPAFALGFYLQATARQPGRERADALERFRHARTLLLQDAGSGDRPNILHFLADCMRLAEGVWGNDVAIWREARQALAPQLESRPGCGFAEYYAEVRKALGDRPDRDAADVFFHRVPYFSIRFRRIVVVLGETIDGGVTRSS